MKKTQVELESRVIQGAHGVSAEEDHILTWKVAQVGIIAIVIFIVGGIWAWRIQVGVTRELTEQRGVASIPALITPDESGRTAYEIGIVNQRLFEQDTHAEQKIRIQEQMLENGWAAEPNVVVRPTISQAMDQIVRERAGTARPQP
jgi:hypothetical protein